jgi:ring-1,2-phenylacetyl-CoA epoxidase subunit PaaC
VSAAVDALLSHVLRQGDRALVLAQRLLQQITHAPEIEEDMALANIALDLLGQARHLYTYAGEIEGVGHDEDHFAYWRDADEFTNPLLVEQPNTDFAHVIARQFLHDSYALLYWQGMATSSDTTLAELAGKAEKETAYHLRHSRSWLVRLGDGTDESHQRVQSALDALMPTTGEMFRVGAADEALAETGVAPRPEALLRGWLPIIEQACAEATLVLRHDGAIVLNDARRSHRDDFADLIGELQVLARAHPGATW